MYKYSKNAQSAFFKRSPLSFIYLWYTQTPEAISFTYRKFNKNPNPMYYTKMTEEIAYLGNQAYIHLS